MQTQPWALQRVAKKKMGANNFWRGGGREKTITWAITRRSGVEPALSPWRTPTRLHILRYTARSRYRYDPSHHDAITVNHPRVPELVADR